MYLCRTGKKRRRKLTARHCSARQRLPSPGAGRPEGCPRPFAHPGGAQKCVCEYLGARGCAQIRDGGTGYPGAEFPTSLPSLRPAACRKLLLCLGLPAGKVWGIGAVTSVRDFFPPSIHPLFTALFFLNKAGRVQRAGQRGKEGDGLRATHLCVRGRTATAVPLPRAPDWLAAGSGEGAAQPKPIPTAEKKSRRKSLVLPSGKPGPDITRGEEDFGLAPFLCPPFL